MGLITSYTICGEKIVLLCFVKKLIFRIIISEMNGALIFLFYIFEEIRIVPISKLLKKIASMS